MVDGLRRNPEESTMQKIHVRRFRNNPHEHQGEIEPEDRSWRVTIDRDGCPQLWLRTKVGEADGQVQHGYICVDDLLPDDMGTCADIMKSEFLDEPTEAECAEAADYWGKRWAGQDGKRCVPAPVADLSEAPASPRLSASQ